MPKIFLFLFIFLFPNSLLAQDIPPSQGVTREEITQIILRLKTGEDGNLRWRECGRFLTSEESLERAAEYASYLLDEVTSDPDFDPWVSLAIIMQESSFNRCAISREANDIFEPYTQAQRNRDPNESDVARLLRSHRFRRSLGIPAFDVGLGQFRWPGTLASLVGLEDPIELLDARSNIRMLARALARYREACTTTEFFRGRRTVVVNGIERNIRFSVACASGYWVQHNGPNQFNYRYYSNVSHWLRVVMQLRTMGSLQEGS